MSLFIANRINVTATATPVVDPASSNAQYGGALILKLISGTAELVALGGAVGTGLPLATTDPALTVGIGAGESPYLVGSGVVAYLFKES